MADLIERDALLKDLRSVCPESDVCFSHESCIDCIVNRQPAVNRWIAVEDALPEDRQRVLICSKSKRLFDVVFRANAKMPSFDTKIFGEVYAWYCEDVIKWMPLSEQPEKE